MWGDMVKVFKATLEEKLHQVFKKEFPNEREIIVFGEYFGENSFAGRHVGEEHSIVPFDIMVGHKNRAFLKPIEFIKLMDINDIDRPPIVYTGNLNDEFIADVRANIFSLKEGVICKGTTTNGAYRGKVWMCKIKTQSYLDSIIAKYGEAGLNLYGE